MLWRAVGRVRRRRWNVSAAVQRLIKQLFSHPTAILLQRLEHSCAVFELQKAAVALANTMAAHL